MPAPALLTTNPGKPWQRRASPLARAALVVWAMLIVYASLAPWSGWRDLGVSPLAYLTAPLPRWITGFDLAVNLLAYLPLGALALLAQHPHRRGLPAVLMATLAGALLAGFIEAVQTYLPTRVPSILDLASNTLGAAAGALLATPFTAALIDRGRLAQLRARWLVRDAAPALLLIALWPLAQIHAGSMLFGNGRAYGTVSDLLDLAGSKLPQLALARFGAAEFVLAEAVAVTAALLAVGLAFVSLMQREAPRAALLAALLAAALLAKSLAYGANFGPDHALAWLSPGALGGLLLGSLTLLAAAAGSPRAQRRVALLAVLVLLVVVNLVPPNPYHAAWLSGFRPGRLVHAGAVAEWLALAWPFALLLWLLLSAPRRG